MLTSIQLAILILGFSLGLGALAQPYSIPVDSDYPKNVYWGDTHLHTRNSADAYSLGNLNLTPADAFRFARGQELIAHNGMRVQLRRPLDFLVVSDHAEYLGGFYRFNVDDPLVKGTEAANRWQRFVEAGEISKVYGTFVGSMQEPEKNLPLPESTRLAIWEDVALTADEHNKPGRFTAFTGYEWTSMIDGNNLHRVVIYRDGAEKAKQLPPFSGQDSLDPRELWKSLERYEKKTGGQVMAIAHNGNISNGMMFPSVSVDGKKIDRAYAELRARWEPIYEVSQVKGDGESHPTLSPDDEFSDFENWDWDNIGRTAEKEEWMLKHEYARGALKLGLEYEKSLGVNPFKIGLIASTDGHNSISTPEEDNFFGKFPESEPGSERLKNILAGRLWQNWKIVASGYAAVWAKENTREAIFDAMKRREVYATTGSRIAVRFFGGWSYEKEDLYHANYLDKAYSQGVPMGGDLTAGPANEIPNFIVLAVKDPDGANLDRIQIIKGWLDENGDSHEKVYDVVWSEGRKRDPETGQLESVGNTVDTAAATFDNSIGTAQLAAVWEDPDFDPNARAFYYVRVLEIPRPRWTTIDAAYFDLEIPEGAPVSIQDRAYTSPIWYTP